MAVLFIKSSNTQRNLNIPDDRQRDRSLEAKTLIFGVDMNQKIKEKKTTIFVDQLLDTALCNECYLIE